MSGRAANGEGSLYQRTSDGRWVGAVFLGYDATGRPLRKTVGAKTRAEAAKKKRELQQHVDQGLPPPDDRLTVTGLFEHWLTQVLPHRVAPATVGNYTSLFNTHIKPALGRKRLMRLQPDDVQHLINEKLNDGLSTRTVRHIRGLLVQALDFGVRRGSVPRNVAAMTEGPRQQSAGEGRSLSIQQARALLRAAEGDRLEALYILMLSTGMRPGEAFGLVWRNVDLSIGAVTIKQALVRQKGGNVIGPGKVGKKGWRTVEVSAPVVEAVRSHRTPRSAITDSCGL